MSRSSPRKRASWRRFWRHSFWARVLLLSFASGVSGVFVGALTGLWNWVSGDFFYSWWYWVGFTAPINGLWMMFLGFLVGALVLSTVAPASSRWSASRQRRFALGMKTRLLLPVAASLIITSLVASFAWIIRHRGLSSTTSDLGNVLGYLQMATLLFSCCLFSTFLARFSRHPRHKKQRHAERLLPLD